MAGAMRAKFFTLGFCWVYHHGYKQEGIGDKQCWPKMILLLFLRCYVQ